MFAAAAAAITLVLPLVAAHQHHLHDAVAVADVTTEEWYKKFGPQADLPFSGPASFNHFPYARCLEDARDAFDIAILGFPFDTTVTNRPGARFGPRAIRIASGRAGYTLAWGASPMDWGARIMDCGDVPLSAFDNAQALDQMEVAYSTLLGRPVQGETKSSTAALSKDGREHPRIVTLGGDHTIVLPILRSLHQVYGPISVIHFDAHFDTSMIITDGPGRLHHGSYFTIAHEEGLLSNTSIHGGIRQHKERSIIPHDESLGFAVITTEDLDDYGLEAVVKTIRRRVGNTPVYLSLDIDTIDPGMAPATGTPVDGGWSTREMKRILRGLSGLNFVGCDVVEVSPAYDLAEITSRAAAGFVNDFLQMMQMEMPPKPHSGPFLE